LFLKRLRTNKQLQGDRENESGKVVRFFTCAYVIGSGGLFSTRNSLSEAGQIPAAGRLEREECADLFTEVY
jgi:hypothetical protein